MTEGIKAIEVKQLTKVYPSKDAPIVALEDATFDVYDQEFVSLVGHSGCGKTTIMKIIAGLLDKTRGEVLVNGAPVTGPKSSTGIVFQTPVLFQWRTIIDNVLLPVEILGLSKDEYYPKALEMLELTGLTEFKDKYPRELSGGMQQRASISRALVHEPSLAVAGRALRRPGRHDPGRDEHGASAHLEREQEDQPADHPQHTGSGFPGGPGHGDDAPSGPYHRYHRHRAAAAPDSGDAVVGGIHRVCETGRKDHRAAISVMES